MKEVGRSALCCPFKTTFSTTISFWSWVVSFPPSKCCAKRNLRLEETLLRRPRLGHTGKEKRFSTFVRLPFGVTSCGQRNTIRLAQKKGCHVRPSRTSTLHTGRFFNVVINSTESLPGSLLRGHLQVVKAMSFRSHVSSQERHRNCQLLIPYYLSTKALTCWINKGLLSAPHNCDSPVVMKLLNRYVPSTTWRGKI